mmetsp:Transcript_63725/g.184831  ORF Transcript_63725/g.184831 Transcript_63725/m.184831 type:complete len:225 (+) Transcript_63725:304-978(+)
MAGLPRLATCSRTSKLQRRIASSACPRRATAARTTSGSSRSTNVGKARNASSRMTRSAWNKSDTKVTITYLPPRRLHSRTSACSAERRTSAWGCSSISSVTLPTAAESAANCDKASHAVRRTPSSASCSRSVMAPTASLSLAWKRRGSARAAAERITTLASCRSARIASTAKSPPHSRSPSGPRETSAPSAWRRRKPSPSSASSCKSSSILISTHKWTSPSTFM